jgi:glycosyltransferase involved in cell wall biosynthesis
MKICKFVEGSFIPSFDGASQRFSNISKNLSNIGVDLTVVHCYRGWSDLNTIKDQNFNTIAISSKYYYYDHSVVDKIMSLIKPDLVEMNDMELLMSTGLYINQKFKIPLLYEAHFVSSVLVKGFTSDPSAILPEKLNEKKVSEIVSGIVFFTDIDKKDFIESTKSDLNLIDVIPLGSDLDNVEYRKVTDDDNVILFLGNMYFQPNQDAVEEIVNEIAPSVLKRSKNVSFRFVGDVPEHIKQKYQSDQFVFTGRLKDINDAFKGVRVCIVPVKTGSGMRVKILTYMASGIPIVSSKIAADGINYQKFLNIADTPSEFSDKIVKILNDLSKSQLQGKMARIEANSSHSWKEIAKKNLAFYEAVLQRPVYSILKPMKVKMEPFWLTETIEKGRFEKVEIDQEIIYFLGSNRMITTRARDFLR